MKWNHCFVLSTPANLIKEVKGYKPWQYDKDQKGVMEEMVERRKEFFLENIFVMTPGRDLVCSIGEAINKILCIHCGLNYRHFNLFVKNFDTAGCDDPEGATALRERVLRGERAI